MSSSYESNRNPRAATAQMSHCSGDSRERAGSAGTSGMKRRSDWTGRRRGHQTGGQDLDDVADLAAAMVNMWVFRPYRVRGSRIQKTPIISEFGVTERNTCG